MNFGANKDSYVLHSDHGNIPATLIGVLSGLLAPWAALVPYLPGWVVQSAATIVSGVFVFAVNKLVGKWIDRKWPDRKKRRKPGDSDE